MKYLASFYNSHGSLSGHICDKEFESVESAKKYAGILNGCNTIDIFCDSEATRTLSAGFSTFSQEDT